jgi:hypothetical protein
LVELTKDKADGIKIVAEDYSGFTQVLRKNFEIVAVAGHDCFLPNPFYTTVNIPFDAKLTELLTDL